MELYKIKNYFEPNRILDIGANVGQFHQMCRYNFPDSYIFSIEASDECAPYLKAITDNFYIGLLAKDDLEYNFYTNKDNPVNTGNSIYKELTDVYKDDVLKIVKKRGIKLDDLFKNNEEFDLIKIDTQGSELDIISGGINICNKAKGILLEVSINEYNENSPLYGEVIQFMFNLGFKPVEILEIHKVESVNLHQQDILFIKQ